MLLLYNCLGNKQVKKKSYLGNQGEKDNYLDNQG